MGIELSYNVRREYRHRYNHRMAERRRPGFPKIGHYDTWLIDAIQIKVSRNHNKAVYGTWLNTNNDCVYTTPESFGVIPLQSNELTAAINALPINSKLSREMVYLAKNPGTKIPITTFTTREEKKVFKNLVLQQSIEDARRNKCKLAAPAVLMATIVALNENYNENTNPSSSPSGELPQNNSTSRGQSEITNAAAPTSTNDTINSSAGPVGEPNINQNPDITTTMQGQTHRVANQFGLQLLA